MRTYLNQPKRPGLDGAEHYSALTEAAEAPGDVGASVTEPQGAISVSNTDCVVGCLRSRRLKRLLKNHLTPGEFVGRLRRNQSRRTARLARL